jgi:hypothetical protein
MAYDKISEQEYEWELDDAVRAEVYCPDGREHVAVVREAEPEVGAHRAVYCRRCDYVFS